MAADPVAPWRYVERDDAGIDVDEQIQRVCAAERAAVCDLAHPPAFRVALIRTAADRHRFVLTNHHIVLDGWSLPILLQEIFASYYGHRLPAAGLIAGLSAGWLIETLLPPRRPGARYSPASTPPHWSVRRAGWAWAREALPRFGCPRRPPGP